MSSHLQNLLVLVAVSWALLYVVRRSVNLLRAKGKGGCVGCSGASSDSIHQKPLITIDPISRAPSSKRSRESG